MTIGKRILQYRAKHNLSQLDMSERLGVSRELVNKLENGKLKPSKMILVKMDLLEKGK